MSMPGSAGIAPLGQTVVLDKPDLARIIDRSGRRATRSSGRPSRKGRSSSTSFARSSNCPSAGPTSKRGEPIGSSAATTGPISATPSGRIRGRSICSPRD